MLDLGAMTYLDHVRHTVAGSQIVFGLMKSMAFGALIAITGCRVGLRAGRAATAAAASGVQLLLGQLFLQFLFRSWFRGAGRHGWSAFQVLDRFAGLSDRVNRL